MPARVVVCVPHHSTRIPGEYLDDFVIPASAILKGTDLGAEKVFAIGCADAVVMADASRYVVDLNRAWDDRSEMGVIIRRDWSGVEVLKRELSKEEVEQRLKRYYDPFYAKVEAALKVGASETSLLIAGHSMDSMGAKNAKDAGKERPDISLGTQGCTTASKRTVNRLLALLREYGYKAVLDRPYSGGHIVKKFGNPPSVDAIQFEVNKKLYMNEETFQLRETDTEKLRSNLNLAISALAAELG